MTKRNIGDEMIKSMSEAVDYMRGKKKQVTIHKVEIPSNINVRAIREKLKLSRQEFADRFGFSIRTLQHWEQGNRHPHGPSRILLLLLKRKPFVIEAILNNKEIK